jgi:hypothetical protein
LLFACHNESFGRGRALDVDSFRLHALANVARRPIIGDVNTFLTTLKAHLHERNRDRVMFFWALVDRAKVVVWTELFERGMERSSVIHAFTFLV